MKNLPAILGTRNSEIQTVESLSTDCAGFWLGHKFSPRAILGHGGHIVFIFTKFKKKQ